MISYYVILGISENASDDEIKQAFKQKAVQFHPDKNQGNPQMEERFKEVNRAYQVLSNPYEKARYDLQMKYGNVHQAQYYQEPPPPPKPRKPYDYAEKEVNWRENWIATAYAFGFTFIVALIVMTFISIKNYVDEKKLEARLMERRELFTQALELHNEGDVAGTLEKLNELGHFMKEEQDMSKFKAGLVKDLVNQSQKHFSRSEFEEAIVYYELIAKYTDVKSLAHRENLAISYRESDQPEKSIEVLTQLLVLGYRNLSTHVEIAKIHRDLLGDDETALRFFENANEVAKEYYESIYGGAYVVVLSGRHLSEVHWELYDGLARAYLSTGNPKMAVKATRWNIRVWPERASSYVIAAKGYEAMGEVDEACDKYQMANFLDPEIEVSEICL